MSDEIQKLGVEIDVTKTGAGGSEAATEIKKATDASNDASKAANKLGDAHEESGKKAEKSEGSHRLLNAIFRMIGRETLPELGHALHGIEFGAAGTILIAGEAAGFLAAKLEEAAEKAEQLKEKEAELSTSLFEERAKAANDAATAAQDYADKLAAIATQTDNVKKAEELELAVLNARAEALKKILEAMEKAELAGAGGDKVKEEEIKSRYENKKSDTDITAETNRIATENQQKFNRERDRDRLKAESDAAEKEKERVTSQFRDDQSEAQLEAARDRLKDSAKEFGPAQQRELDDLREKLKSAATVTGELGESEHQHIQEQIDALEESKKKYEQNVQEVTILNREVEAHKEAIKKATDAAEKALTAYKENEAAIKEYTDRIKQETAILDIHKQTDKTTREIGAPQTPFGASLLGEKSDAIKILTGHADDVDQAHQDLIKKLGALIAGHAVSLKDAAQLIAKADSSMPELMEAIASMTRTAETMRTFSINTSQRLDQIERDIANLIESGNHTRASQGFGS